MGRLKGFATVPILYLGPDEIGQLEINRLEAKLVRIQQGPLGLARHPSLGVVTFVGTFSADRPRATLIANTTAEYKPLSSNGDDQSYLSIGLGLAWSHGY